LPINKCRACTTRDVVTVFQGGSCQNYCQKLSANNTAQNATQSTASS
jgi:hypothetical protein